MWIRRFLDAFGPYIVWFAAALAGLVVLAVLVSLLGWRPPAEFTIATGRQGGAYYAYATEYQRRLAELGYTLHIRETAGGIETIELLNRGEVDAGFVQNTVDPGIASPDLSTLAAIYYEALWVFYRDDLPVDPTSTVELAGLRINIGEEGSATYEDALTILALNGITAENATLEALPVAEAAQLLKDGEIDALMIFAGAASPLVADLLETPGIRLLPFQRAQAYASNYKYLAKVVLPEGAIDLEENIPSQDTPLIAARATLVVGPTIHPDLARLLLIIASEVHKPGSLFEAPDEFPSSTFVGIPMNADAERYLQNGSTILEKYFPLWLASRLERFLFLLLPFFLIVYPIVRGIPSLVSLAYERRLKQRYQDLRAIDREYEEYDPAQLDAAISKLEREQAMLAKETNVPMLMLDDLYNLRYHAGLVLERLKARRAALEETS
jgi:TRAP transporter TAXI family solute receptor